MNAVEQAFQRQGFSVSRNVPFAGAYIVQQYGRPSAGQHAIQIELDRSLYMDEIRIEKNAQFTHIKARLRAVVQELCMIRTDEISIAAQ